MLGRGLTCWFTDSPPGEVSINLVFSCWDIGTSIEEGIMRGGLLIDLKVWNGSVEYKSLRDEGLDAVD